MGNTIIQEIINDFIQRHYGAVYFILKVVFTYIVQIIFNIFIN